MGDEDECLDVGALQAHAAGPTYFGVQSRYRGNVKHLYDGTDWLVAEISRQQRNFAQTPQLVMWIRTVLFAVGVQRLMFPFMHAMSRTEPFEDKKLIESCCIVFRLMVFQKKELLVERCWPRVFPSMVQKMQDEDRGFVTSSIVHLCHVFLRHLCTCAHFRRALESQVTRCLTFVITSGCTIVHCALYSHW